MEYTARISKWGNSRGIRIPSEVLRKAELDTDAKVIIENQDDKIVIMKAAEPRRGTLAYLFKDYAEGGFDTPLSDLGEPVGEEKW